jgi:hypothetical protein
MLKKQKINILVGNEAKMLGLYYGYWNWFFLFKKELVFNGLEINFFKKLSPNFFDADHLFLNSRSFPQINGFIDLECLKKIYQKNQSLYWFDMRDSAGTTQFEVLPYVKKYVKKQFYKDINNYKKKLKGGRFYTDYYIRKYKVKDDKDYLLKNFDDEFYPKLILGWNLGVAFFFDYVNYSNINYFLEYMKFKILKKYDYNYKLPFYENWDNDDKKFDFVSLMNLNFKRKSVGYQRLKLQNIISSFDTKKKFHNTRIPKKNFYDVLKNSKVSIGAYGWGEICYREFEATVCGVPFMTADMSNINTWPNIYIDGETYLSYNYDITNLEENLNKLIVNKKLRKKLVKNSQKILKDCYNDIGMNYFLNKLFEILK